MGNPWQYDFSAIGARTAPLLIVIGGDGDPAARRGGQGYSLHGNSDVHQLIPADVAFDQLNMSRPFFNPREWPDLNRYDCVLNLITDPDQHPRSLARLHKLTRGYRGRLINRPEAVLRSTRDQVARRLTGIAGLRVPKTLRLRNPKPGAASAAAARAAMALPVIVRRAGTHSGETVTIIADPAELDRACAGPGEFILTEFVDFAGGDGLYRKYRLWSFGGQPILKMVVASDHWNIHTKDRDRIMADRPDLRDQERRAMERPEGDLPEPVHAMFRQVQRRLGLDFFGMDFGILPSGEALLFEANATMNFKIDFKPPWDYLNRVDRPARAAFAGMLGVSR